MKLKSVWPCLALPLLQIACSTDEPTPKHPDIGISHIQRLPRVDFIENSTNPTRDGWPTVDQTITWAGIVKNYSMQSYSKVKYEWLKNGTLLESGQFDLQSNGEAQIALQQKWSFERDALKLIIDPDQELQTDFIFNNGLEVFTNGLGVGFYVEETFYNHHLQHEKLMTANLYSFDDWIQKQMMTFNTILQSAGVNDRVRIDNITIVQDGKLPLNKMAYDIDDPTGVIDRALSLPNLDDRSVDFQWGFPSRLLQELEQSKLEFISTDYLLHEMCHARYLPDNYGFSLYHNVNNSRIDIQENGNSIVGSYFTASPTSFNGQSGFKVYTTKENDLMAHIEATPKLFLGKYSSQILNFLSGQRAVTGNWNSPPDRAKIINLIPDKNFLTIKTREDEPCADCKVWVYQSSRPGINSSKATYAYLFDNIPDQQLITDASGVVDVGSELFGKKGALVHELDYSNALVILRIESPLKKVGYGILQVSDFNIEYMKGNTTYATYEMPVSLR